MRAAVPTFEDFVAAYPRGLAGNLARALEAWASLSGDERSHAHSLLPRWIAERHAAGFRFFPPAQSYLVSKAFASLIDAEPTPIPAPPSFEEFWAVYDAAPCFHKRKPVAEAEFALLPDHERVFAGRYAANEAAARKLLFSVGIPADQWLRERRYRDLMGAEQHLTREARP